MFRQVLFPTDGSRHSLNAANYLIQLKRSYPDIEITQLYVRPGTPEDENQAAAVLRASGHLFAEAGIQVKDIVTEGNAAQKIVEFGNRHDLVVMGARGVMQEGRGYLKDIRVWLGSVSRKVLHRVQKPVILVKLAERQMKKYLLATDGSECALQAAKYLIDMIQNRPDAEVTILHVATQAVNYVAFSVPTYGFVPLPSDLPDDMLESAESVAAETVKLFEQAGISHRTLYKMGVPAVEIGRVAKEGQYDLAVLGSHGYGAFDRLLLGSVSERVAEEAECPVLVVK